jgi:hypothetical protein
MIWMLIWPDHEHLGQEMIPVVASLSSNCFRGMAWPQAGQTCALSQRISVPGIGVLFVTCGSSARRNTFLETTHLN